MVKVTEKYLFRKFAKTHQIQPKKKGETDSEYLSRVTHLYLQSQFVDHIAPIPDCTSVSVIYLQNNQLQTIHNMENFPNLTYLYLQNNHISKIENLNGLKHLKKLYLGSNEISVLEGLDKLENLIELHLENQRLSEGETIFFDPRTIKNLGKTLGVFNIAKNNITSLKNLSGMTRLEALIANDNKLADMDEVTATLATLPRLRKLKLAANPIASDRKYREDITLASKSLRLLDEKEITPETRNFVESLASTKVSRMEMIGKETKPSSVQTKVQSMPELMKTRRNALGQEKMASSVSGSKLFPLMKMHFLKMPRTVSSFSANVPPHYFHKSLRAFQYGPFNSLPIPNLK